MGAKGRPRSNVRPKSEKAPKATSLRRPTSSDKPLFCFEHTDRAGDARWAFSPSDQDSAEILSFMCDMAKLSWREIEGHTTGGHNRHRKHHDYESTAICPAAQTDYEKARYGETFGDTIFRFRVGGKKRLWGFRDGQTFHVAWWDPDHQVCPTDRQ